MVYCEGMSRVCLTASARSSGDRAGGFSSVQDTLDIGVRRLLQTKGWSLCRLQLAAYAFEDGHIRISLRDESGRLLHRFEVEPAETAQDRCADCGRQRGDELHFMICRGTLRSGGHGQEIPVSALVL